MGAMVVGSVFFVNDYIKHEAIDLMNISNDIFQSVAVRVTCTESNKIFNILGIYRPPIDTNINPFSDSLRDILSQNMLSSNDTVIAGDFNICIE